ncbi:uncharacterized protein LOC119296920 [Triticum dicoccoides]|uniref:uncharacterized protein LOC119296920 n=1 Tax=Triticum dicoccoides TaxID=85692 RepID=UPI00188E7FBE|nr:uncharacterized protein LOC119296920 [Triticum dicoccoides]
MAMGQERRIKLLMAVVLLLTLAKGNSCNRTCTVADLEIRHIRVDSYTQEQEQQNMNSVGGGGRKLKQLPMIMAVWVYNHCPCMVDNVVIYAPDGFSTIYANGTDERIFSKVREHLYLIHHAGPLLPAASCPRFPHSSPENTSAAGAGPVDGKAQTEDFSCPSTAFFYTWYEEIELKPAFLVPHC